MHAERENVLLNVLLPRLPALANQRKDAYTSELEKPHQLTSVCELVFMASPTLPCDGLREDSTYFAAK